MLQMVMKSELCEEDVKEITQRMYTKYVMRKFANIRCYEDKAFILRGTKSCRASKRLPGVMEFDKWSASIGAMARRPGFPLSTGGRLRCLKARRLRLWINMLKKILINGITLERANLVPLLLKIRTWQSFDCEITIFGNDVLKEQIDSLGILKSYYFIELKNTNKSNNTSGFIFESLKRNLYCLPYFKTLTNKYDVIYSISSVLDLILFPYFLKKIDKNIKWVAVFDNIVPFMNPGNKFIRFLAWSFFQISLIFLKNADKIFAISQDLKYFLLKKGFRYDQIVVTGNAIETDLIKKAKKNDKYNMDALFIGRINETKGIYDMLKVLNIVKEKYPDFRLAIMGKGDEATEKQFKEKIIYEGLENNIQFLGYRSRSEKFNIIKSSRCFWFLSESESFGLALLEAVCCGLPSFAYDLQPYKHIYKNNEVMIFKIKDYQSIAEKVIEIFDKKNFENEVGKLLVDKYNWDKIAEIEVRNL